MPLRKRRTPLRKWLDDHLDERLEPHVRERLLEMSAELNEYGFDPFGFSPAHLKYVLPLVTFLYKHYFRVESYGVDHVPTTGPVILVSNHSGQIALDGLMIGGAMLLDNPTPRIVRSMVERWVPTLPFLSYLFPRWGQIIGTRENCRALFTRNQVILVFPEGVRGCNKTFDKRYQLQEFGNGFMRLALEDDIPIVPIAVVGAEEQIINLYDAKKLGKMLGMPALPVGPGLLMGPVGMVTPLPVKYHIHFGEPMHFSGSPDEDDRLIAEKVEEVKRVIGLMLNDGLKRRRGVFR